MCGIAGFIHPPFAESEARVRLGQMLDRIAHRGPDGEGMHVAPGGVAMGMRRLSIVDLEGGGQPIWNEDGTIGVVFNGEIYNHLELRRALEARGHRLHTRSDTEVLVHLYEDLGPELLARLRGMFAFAILDLRCRAISAARAARRCRSSSGGASGRWKSGAAWCGASAICSGPCWPSMWTGCSPSRSCKRRTR